jgi:hypothetical protein
MRDASCYYRGMGTAFRFWAVVALYCLKFVIAFTSEVFIIEPNMINLSFHSTLNTE